MSRLYLNIVGGNKIYVWHRDNSTFNDQRLIGQAELLYLTNVDIITHILGDTDC